ncbi:MAG: dihydrodipicolinate synthase family protein [Bacteroidetes bacterium]|nr:MAG: dihydrodipicolinate synthase family protein [Bacteroidota bacterium]
MELTGIFPPMITPFRADETLDTEAHIYNVQQWYKVQLGGYVVLGSNSEAVFLNESEKLQLVELTVAHAAPGRKVIVGSGMESTRESIHLTRAAAALGAHAALVITPHYYGSSMSPLALVQHYYRLADASSIPILIYHVAKFTHLQLTPSTVEQLARHPNIIGMKDSSGSIPQLIQYQQVVEKDFQLLAGTASVWYPALCLGVKGAVMALANCAPDPCVQVQQAFLQGELQQAEDCYRQLFPLNQAVTATYGIAGLKYACELCGYRAGRVRSPLLPLREEDKKQIEHILKTAAVLP